MLLPEVGVRSFARANDEERRAGLLAYLVVAIGPVIVDGVAIRRMASGRIGLSYPARTKANGRRFSIVRPADDQTREALEREILRQLTQRADLAEEDLW